MLLISLSRSKFDWTVRTCLLICYILLLLLLCYDHLEINISPFLCASWERYARIIRNIFRMKCNQQWKNMCRLLSFSKKRFLMLWNSAYIATNEIIKWEEYCAHGITVSFQFNKWWKWEKKKKTRRREIACKYITTER